MGHVLKGQELLKVMTKGCSEGMKAKKMQEGISAD